MSTTRGGATGSPLEDLRSAGFRGRLREEEPLAGLTTWRIGGPAELLATPEDVDDVQTAVAWARESGTPWRVLGNGSNLLVRDEGVRGLVLRLRRTLDRFKVDAPMLEAGAGASFPALARLAASRGLAGLEFAGGIPGTLGGAVLMNAGWHEFEIGNVVERVLRLDPDGDIAEIPARDCAFAYRSSAFRGTAHVVLAATLRLRPDAPSAIRERMNAFLQSRKTNQPTELPSCGSVFVQPPGDFAGRLIDAAGLKGTRRGAIEISPKHANFFVNHGPGSSDDVLALVDFVERTVLQRFGVELRREFEIW